MIVFAPHRWAMSASRTPKYPLRQTIAVSPRSITLTHAVSIAPVPVADMGMVTWLRVWNTWRSISQTSSIT